MLLLFGPLRIWRQRTPAVLHLLSCVDPPPEARATVAAGRGSREVLLPSSVSREQPRPGGKHPRGSKDSRAPSFLHFLPLGTFGNVALRSCHVWPPSG